MQIKDFSAIDFYQYDPNLDTNRYYNYKVKKKTKFSRGAKYTLRGASCDGFDMPEKVYEVVSVVNSINDVPLNSVVMRQLEGPDEDKSFCLSRNDCKTLHIKYQQDLLLFPQEMAWKRENPRLRPGDQETFDTSDMSTYAKSRIDGTIRYMILKINGFCFDDTNTNIINMSNGKTYHSDIFLSALKVKANGYISYAKDMFSNQIVFYKKDEQFPFRIITKDFLGLEEDPDFGNCLFIEVCLRKPAKGYSSEDGYSGIVAQAFKGKTIEDIFNISIDEFKIGKRKSFFNNKKDIPVQYFGQVKSMEDLKVNDMVGKTKVGSMWYVQDQNKIVLNRDGLFVKISPNELIDLVD